LKFMFLSGNGKEVGIWFSIWNSPARKYLPGLGDNFQAEAFGVSKPVVPSLNSGGSTILRRGFVTESCLSVHLAI